MKRYGRANLLGMYSRHVRGMTMHNVMKAFKKKQLTAYLIIIHKILMTQIVISYLCVDPRAVESEVPSSDSDSWQFRLSDSDSNSDSG